MFHWNYLTHSKVFLYTILVSLVKFAMNVTLQKKKKKRLYCIFSKTLKNPIYLDQSGEIKKSKPKI